MSKRRLLATSLKFIGATRVLEALPPRPGILVINHHRIGEAGRSRFDRGVFSATEEQLEKQVAYCKRRFPIVSGEELRSLLRETKPLKHLYVVFTFDDGYLDNYRKAFPIFRAHSVRAIFFLVPEYVGTSTVPWWDAIAFQVRQAQAKSIELTTPTPLRVPLEGSREKAIQQVLRHYCRQDNMDVSRFMSELQTAAACQLPEAGRRFLDWDEAAEMQRAEMEIGSHTTSHRILSQLPAHVQQEELLGSKQYIEQHLKKKVFSLAYPVGRPTSFTAETERLAQSTGYQACFSFFGGMNPPEQFSVTNLFRMSVDPDPLMFRNEITLMASLGKLPYA